MNKIGVAYNVFDGIENLPISINQIKPYVDYITVVYQDFSNVGNSISKINKFILEVLFANKVIDNLILYEPKGNDLHNNECCKRNIGLQDCISNNCNYFISMDCDEIYDGLKFAQEYLNIKEKKIDKSFNSYCYIQDYYSSGKLKYRKLANYFVPFIAKIDSKSTFNMGNPELKYIDPTRRVWSKNTSNLPILINSDNIVMDHLTMVRANIKSLKEKFINSSSPEYRNSNSFDDYAMSIFNYHKDNNINLKIYQEVADKYDTEKVYKSFNQIEI